MSYDSKVEPMQLTFGSTDTVDVIVDDRHRWKMTVHEAAQACKYAFDIGMWAEEFKDLLFCLAKWCGNHQDLVSRCFVSWGEGGLHIFVVTHGDEFQFDFHDEITSLDLMLVQAYPDHPADVMQLPEEPPGAIHSFVSSKQSIQVYGHRTAAQGQG